MKPTSELQSKLSDWECAISDLNLAAQLESQRLLFDQAEKWKILTSEIQVAVSKLKEHTAGVQQSESVR